MKHFIITAIGGWLLSQPLLAQTPELLNSLTRGDTIQSQNETYVRLPNVRSEQGSGSTTRSNRQQVLEQKGSFTIYEAPASEPVEENSFPVLLNQRTQKFGVVTGVVQVTLKKAEDLQSFVTEHSVVASYPHMKFLSLKPPAGTDIFDFLSQIRQDSRIQQADLQIVENIRVPQ